MLELSYSLTNPSACSGVSERLCNSNIMQSNTISVGENNMKSSTKDQAKGVFYQAKGTIKEIVGKASMNHELEGEGMDEKRAGKIKKKIGEIEKVVGK